MRRWDYRSLAGLPVLAVGIFAGVISYNDILSLALGHNFHGVPAHLLPLVVDMLIVAGSVMLLWPAAEQAWLGWVCVGPGVAATVFANIESQLPHGWISATVAAWAAAALCLATFTFERWLRAQFRPAPSTVAEVQPPVAGCGHEPVGDAERDVQLQYLHTRDCLGETPSVRQLSAASGLTRYKVAELTKPLNGHGTLEPVS